MAQSLSEVVESLYAGLPHVTLDVLNEYGLEIPPAQAHRVYEEMLSLSLYWVRSALQANLGAGRAERVLTALKRRIAIDWNERGMGGMDPTALFEAAESRCAAYDRIVQEGGSPVAVLGESAAALEFSGEIDAGNRQKLLALFLDLIPVDAFGELLDGVELADSE